MKRVLLVLVPFFCSLPLQAQTWTESEVSAPNLTNE